MSFWTEKATGYDDGEVAYDNSSTMELKRPHQWFMIGTEPKTFPNKKQAIEVPSPNPFSGSLNSDVYHWENASGINSVMGLFTEQLLYPGNCTHIDLAYNNCISVGQSYNKVNDCPISSGHSLRNFSNAVSVDTFFIKDYKEDDSDITISMDDPVMSMSPPFMEYQNSNNLSTNNSYRTLEQSAISASHTSSSSDQPFGKRESNIISFGGQDDDGISCSSFQRQALNKKGLDQSNIKTVASVGKNDHNGLKRVHQNNFPMNVRSLLSTGILDEVPVKYIAWSRKKELHGVIKGCGYLCGCQSCNLSKAINGFEFERHAGCKTKHPNNHIYFESGKTIYGVVQELRNTPQDLLFEVMQKITGSSVNQKAFNIWRDSFQAATRELQRIYGKDEGKQYS